MGFLATAENTQWSLGISPQLAKRRSAAICKVFDRHLNKSSELSQNAKDPLVEKWETTECTFRLIRTPNGEVFALEWDGTLVELKITLQEQ